MTFVNDTRAIIRDAERNKKSKQVEAMLLAAVLFAGLILALSIWDWQLAEQAIENQELRGSL